MVMRSLVGAFCGPRMPTFLRRDAGSASRAGRKPLRSVEVISRTSPRASTRALDFGIAAYLARIGLRKADHPDSITRFREAQNMQTFVEQPERHIARFALVSPFVNIDQRTFKIEVRG